MSETRSIREVPHPRADRDEPGSRAVLVEPRSARPLPVRPAPGQSATPVRLVPEPRAPRARPDPNPIRLMMGLVGIASASAFTSAMLPSILPRSVQALVADAAASPSAATATTSTPVTDTTASPGASVLHAATVVKLKAGQTAAPTVVAVQATPAAKVATVLPTPQVAAVQPSPTPKPHVVTTRQSGAP